MLWSEAIALLVAHTTCWASESPGRSRAGGFHSSLVSVTVGPEEGGRAAVKPFQPLLSWDRSMSALTGDSAQGRQWSPGSHGLLVAELRATTIMSGALDGHCYVNTTLPFNYVWKIRLIPVEPSEHKSTPTMGIHWAPCMFSDKG